MNEEEFYQYISLGHEQRSIEFKSAGPKTNKQLLVQVVKAAIGMANTRDGGIIIIGIDEINGNQLHPAGLNPDDLLTWSFDSLADSFAEYADPTILFDTELVDYHSSKFYVIKVHEFLDTPIICKKSYPNVLRSGACYIRPRRKPETTEPPSHADMQDLLNLGIEKGIRHFISQAKSSGFSISSESIPSDQDNFNNQIKDILDPERSSDIVRKIYSRGHWVIRIYPALYNKKKITDISSLLPIIQGVIVRIRGWDFPHLDSRTENIIGLDNIGQELDWNDILSSWYFFQSGQFIQISCIPIDWRDRSPFKSSLENWKPGQLLGIGYTVATFTEIFELASRLATTDVGDDRMHISIKIRGLKDRNLYVDNSNRWPLDFPRKATLNEYPLELEFDRNELITNSNKLALQQSLEFFKRFHFDTTFEILKSWQDLFFR